MTSVSSRSLSLMSLPSLNISLANNNNDTSMMHQDNHRLLHNHSIQHISQSTSDIISCMSPKDVCVSSPISRYGDSEDSPKINQQSDAFSDLDRNDMRKINNCVMDDLSDARSSSVSSYQADSFHREPDDDRISCCSDDSELSVGKEVDENEQAQEIMLPARTNHNTRTKKHSLIEDAIDDSNDNSIADRSNLMCASEEASNESSKYTTLTPNSSRDESVRFPIARPSPTRLQEEFLRNSQLYAEELMKHQMSFMAVTKGLNICSKINDHTFGFPVRPDLVSPMKSDEQPKIGFRPLVRTTTMEKDQRWQTSIDDRSSPQSPEGINFRGIHSHLNAISKITSALGRGDMINLMSPGSMTSRESSQSPPNNIQQMILHNNIMHDSNLKFSIDNILKPGFGRRITDPLLKRNKTNKKQRLNQEKKLHEKNGTPIDLTATTTTTMTTATTPTPSSSAAETPPPNSNEQDKMTSTSNSTSKSPMVWPAWVYCTRYSDRPSSGPRTRRPKKPPSEKGSCSSDEKRPRTAFSGPQLARLKHEFAENRYLTERRRQQLSSELGLNEAQIKIWFQNKRAKIKKSSGHKNPLALQLMAQGLYNHSTVPLTREEEELQELQAQAKVGA